MCRAAIASVRSIGARRRASGVARAGRSRPQILAELLAAGSTSLRAMAVALIRAGIPAPQDPDLQDDADGEPSLGAPEGAGLQIRCVRGTDRELELEAHPSTPLPLTSHDVIARMLNLLNELARWCLGAGTWNASGRPCSPTSLDAVPWSLEGSIKRPAGIRRSAIWSGTSCAPWCRTWPGRPRSTTIPGRLMPMCWSCCTGRSLLPREPEARRRRLPLDICCP